MKIEYSRNLNGSFMIVREAGFLYENYELMMLLDNRIPGLLSLQVIVGDGKIEYWYDVTGMTSLETMLGNETLGAEKLRRLTEDIFDMNRGLENYLLDGNNICYLPAMVYYDRELEKYRFCYLPGSNADLSLRLRGLMECLLTKLDHTDPEAVEMGYTLYEKSTREGCSVQELLACTAVAEAPAEKEKEGQELWPGEEKEASRGLSLVSEPGAKRRQHGLKGGFLRRGREQKEEVPFDRYL